MCSMCLGKAPASSGVLDLNDRVRFDGSPMNSSAVEDMTVSLPVQVLTTVVNVPESDAVLVASRPNHKRSLRRISRH